MAFELAEVYENEYDQAVKHSFPPFPRGLAGKYYEEGLGVLRDASTALASRKSSPWRTGSRSTFGAAGSWASPT